jgi:Fe-S-cluster-containing hydrogenase component 2
MSVKFNKAVCDENPISPVTRMCPAGAVSIDRSIYRPTIDESKCTGCEICVSSCPRGAMPVD